MRNKKFSFRDTRYAYENMQNFQAVLKLYENLAFRLKWVVNTKTASGPVSIIIRLFKSEIKNLVLKMLGLYYFCFFFDNFWMIPS